MKMEALTVREGREALPYHQQLSEVLGLDEQAAEQLTKMYRAYCAEQRLSPSDEKQTLRVIRDFVHDKKSDLKEAFEDSVLGERTCFAASIRCALLAGSLGIETRLARSKQLTRLLHILVVRPNGENFDLTDPHKEQTAVMTLKEVGLYAAYIQPFATYANRLYGEKKPKKRPALTNPQ